LSLSIVVAAAVTASRVMPVTVDVIVTVIVAVIPVVNLESKRRL
jgi:hypothetical protein